MQINKEQKKYNCWFSVWEVRGDSMNLQWHKVFSELTCVLYVPLQAFMASKDQVILKWHWDSGTVDAIVMCCSLPWIIIVYLLESDWFGEAGGGVASGDWTIVQDPLKLQNFKEDQLFCQECHFVRKFYSLKTYRLKPCVNWDLQPWAQCLSPFVCRFLLVGFCSETEGTRTVMCSVTMPKKPYPLQEVKRVVLEQTVELTPRWKSFLVQPS